MGKWDQYEVAEKPGKWDKYSVPEKSDDIPTVTMDKAEAEKNLLPSPKSDGLEKSFADKVLPYIEKRINDNPNDEDALYQMGRVKLLQKDYGTALSIFSGLSAKNPQQPSYLQGMANAEYNLGQQKQGLQTQKEAQNKTADYEPSLEERETERLRPYQERMKGALGAVESVAKPFTAPVESINAGFNSLVESGEAFEKGEDVKGFLKGVQGAAEGAIGAGMASANGLIFNSAVQLSEYAGTPTGKLLAPISSLTPGYDKLSDNTKIALSLADLAVVGVAMHKIGEPFSKYKEVAKSEPEKLATAIEEAKKSTPEEQQAALQHLDNPEGAKIEQKSVALNKDINNPDLPPDVKTLLQSEKQKVDDQLSEQTKKHTETVIKKAETDEQIGQIEKSIPLAKSESAKKILLDKLNELKPKEKDVREEKIIEPSATTDESGKQEQVKNNNDGKSNEAQSEEKSESDDLRGKEEILLNPLTEQVGERDNRSESEIKEPTSSSKDGIKEADAIAKEHGFDSAKHLLNAEKKYLGTEHKTVQEISKKNLKELKKIRNDLKEESGADRVEKENTFKDKMQEVVKKKISDLDKKTPVSKIEEKIDSQNELKEKTRPIKKRNGKIIEPHPEVSTETKTVAKELGLSDADAMVYDALKDVPEEKYVDRLQKMYHEHDATVDAIDKKISDNQYFIEKTETERDEANDERDDRKINRGKRDVLKKEKIKRDSEFAKELKELDTEKESLESEKKKAEDLRNEFETYYTDADNGETSDVKNIIDRVNARLETRQSVKEGTNLFPESANISELQKGLDKIENARKATKKFLKDNNIISSGDAKKSGFDTEKLIDAAFDLAKVAYKAGKDIQVAIKAAIDHIKDSEWYKSLSEDDQKVTQEAIGEYLKTELEEKLSATKNVVTEEKAAKLGFSEQLEKATKSAAHDFGTVWEEARAAIEEKQIDPAALRKELAVNPRPVTDLENAILVHDQATLENSLDKVVDAINKEPKGERLIELQNEKQLIQNDLYDNFLASKSVGTATARGLNARKLLADKNFSLANMQNEFRAQQDGKPLTAEQEKWVEEKYQQIREKSKAWDEHLKNYEAERKKMREEIQAEIEKKFSDQHTKIINRSKAIATKIRAGKIGNDIAMVGVPFAKEVWNGAVEVMAQAVELGGTLAAATQKGIAFIRQSDWYKNLSKEDQQKAESKFSTMESSPLMKDDYYLSASKKRYQTMIDKYRAKLEAGDFAPINKKKQAIDAEVLKLKSELQKAKDDWHIGKEKLRLEQRGWKEKGVDGFLRYVREGLLSSPTTLAKLASFAAFRQGVMRPLYNLAGTPFSFMEISKVAPTEGRMNLSALAENYKTFGRKETYRQAYQKLKGAGKSSVDLAHGENERVYGELPLLPTKSHGAIKHIPLQAEMNYAKKAIEGWAVKNGKDIADPAVQDWINKYSYAKGLDAIYMGESKLLRQYQMNLRMLENKGGAKYALAKTAKFLFPIIKVPYNFIKDAAIKHTPFQLATSMREAFAKDVQKLSPEEADAIMLNMKKGLVGTAMWGLGMFLAQKNFGGNYTREDKKKNNILDVGDVSFSDKHIPHWATHNSLVEAAQLGATAANIFKDAPKEDGVTEDIAKSFIMTTFSELDKAPFYGELSRDVRHAETWKGIKTLAANQTMKLIPLIIQNTAPLTDEREGKLKPNGYVESVESKLPYLRKNVPLKTKKKSIE